MDDAHSFVEFSVRLIGFNRVRGTFPDYAAHIYYDPDSVPRSAVSLRIAVAGVSTHEPERDRHLESAAFFDAAKFPYMRFDSREIVADRGGFVARGDLTIRDVTRPITIPFAITAPLGEDPFGNPRFSAAGRVTISRHEFGVDGPKFWNAAIGDSVEIEFEIGARRWDYDRLGWGNPRRRSIGERILRTTDSLLWIQQHADTTWNFGLFEYVKCAGRLGQRNRAREGADVLKQAIELRADSIAASDLADLRCLRAELLMRRGWTLGPRRARSCPGRRFGEHLHARYATRSTEPGLRGRGAARALAVCIARSTRLSPPPSAPWPRRPPRSKLTPRGGASGTLPDSVPSRSARHARPADACAPRTRAADESVARPTSAPRRPLRTARCP